MTRKTVIITLLFVVAVIAYGTFYDAPQAVASQATPQRTQPAQQREIPSAIPTATINWQATAQIAQATADEARRVNAAATVQYLSLINEQIEFTASAEQREQDRASWTASAAGTVIPLTATAAIMRATDIAGQQNLIYAGMTATKDAPRLMIESKAAEAYNGRLDFYVKTWSISMFGFACIVLPAIIWASRRRPDPEPAKQEETPVYPRPMSNSIPDDQEENETVIKIKTLGSYPSMDRMTIPCTRRQFSELVEGVLSGTKTLGINKWEGADSIFSRKKYIPVRNFMQVNGWVYSTGKEKGGLALSALGEQIFIAWKESQQLPNGYNFQENNLFKQDDNFCEVTA